MTRRLAPWLAQVSTCTSSWQTSSAPTPLDTAAWTRCRPVWTCPAPALPRHPHGWTARRSARRLATRAARRRCIRRGWWRRWHARPRSGDSRCASISSMHGPFTPGRSFCRPRLASCAREIARAAWRWRTGRWWRLTGWCWPWARGRTWRARGSLVYPVRCRSRPTASCCGRTRRSQRRRCSWCWRKGCPSRTQRFIPGPKAGAPNACIP